MFQVAFSINWMQVGQKTIASVRPDSNLNRHKGALIELLKEGLDSVICPHCGTISEIETKIR